ncbi:MAG: hypothetical protein EBT22_09570, partial [Chloroflexi bacterium]|nr:hypothetical protein [Chloroflexota bacterium]
GALAETHSLLSRIRELSVQSANDTLTARDRANLQAEVNQLVSEVDRIASTAQFNGIALLNKNSTVSTHDSGDGLQFQIGANSSGSANNLTLTIGGARTQDLGSVKTLSGINSAITSGTFTIGGSTGNTRGNRIGCQWHPDALGQQRSCRGRRNGQPRVHSRVLRNGDRGFGQRLVHPGQHRRDGGWNVDDRHGGHGCRWFEHPG